MEDISVALPHRIAARLVRDSEHDIEMPTGLAILVVVLAQFLWGVLGGVSSPVGAFLLFLVSQATFNLNADHYSIYMHTETHKYWTPHGTWTFLGKGSSLLGLSLPNVPLMDYLWFLTGYPPAWGMLLGPSALSSIDTQTPHLNTLKYDERRAFYIKLHVSFEGPGCVAVHSFKQRTPSPSMLARSRHCCACQGASRLAHDAPAGSRYANQYHGTPPRARAFRTVYAWAGGNFV